MMVAMSTDLGTLGRSRFLWKNGKKGDLVLGQVEIFKERDQRYNWLYKKVKGIEIEIWSHPHRNRNDGFR